MRFLRHLRGGLGCFFIFLCVGGCMLITVVSLDAVCYHGLSQRFTLYPEATMVYRQHNQMREWGLGNTVIEMYSPDEPTVVRAFYSRHEGAYLRASLESPFLIDQASRRLANGDWSVVRAEDGVGSQILLFGTCAN